MDSYYTHYIVIGGSRDGETMPRTPSNFGLAKAIPDAESIRPCRPFSGDYDGGDEYEAAIDWGNATVLPVGESAVVADSKRKLEEYRDL